MSTALVIGGGPAGLMAADVLSAEGHAVTVVDAMPSIGRKFLMAGKSGLNLTKDEPPDAFLDVYGTVPQKFTDAIQTFGPVAVQDWARNLGQTIFTGSTGRVFPDVMKASPLLRAWLTRLGVAGVTVQTRHHWNGWQDGVATFTTPDGPKKIAADVTVLACGGASWSRLGASGKWANHIDDVAPFKPANCGFRVSWTSHMATHFGTPVKATRLISQDRQTRGEWIISKDGIEGGGIYNVAAAVRDGAPLHVDLMPDQSQDVIASRIGAKSTKTTRSQILTKVLRLPPVKVALFHEFSRGLDISDPTTFAQRLKNLPILHDGPLPIDDAISTAGGLRFDALDDQFMLLSRPGVFAAGEMLDWEAPTGGYLITGCIATGRAAGRGALRWLNGTS